MHPTCIHAHTSRAHQVARIAAPNIPLIVSRRVSFPLHRRFSTAWKYGGVHHFIAVSTAASEALRGLDIDAKRISIIGDGVDEHRFAVKQPIDWSSCGLPADAQVVCNVAALSPDKNHAGLIQAWQHVEAQFPTAHLVIAGTGPCANDLRQQIHMLGLTRVHLLGFRDDIPALLQGSQLFVMNSLNEGLCSSILEAQRCALPIIATHCGGIPEIVQDGISGRLVPVGDVQALADALAESLRHPKTAWGEAGFHTSQAYTATAMAQAHLQLYQRLFSDAFPRQAGTLGPQR
jgi:glycosyltransferase involved in cell wall biosynthesis